MAQCFFKDTKSDPMSLCYLKYLKTIFYIRVETYFKLNLENVQNATVQPEKKQTKKLKLSLQIFKNLYKCIFT